MKRTLMPFSGHTVVQTGDVGAAEEALRRSYLPTRLRTVRRSPALDTRLDVADLGRATVGTLRFGSEVRILTDEAQNFHVDIPLSGMAVSRRRNAPNLVTEPGFAQVFMPGERADLQWTANTRQLCVMLETSALEHHLAELLGADLPEPLSFEATMDLRSPAGNSWMHVLRLVQLELRRGDGLLSHAMMRRNLERLLIESLLTGHQHNYTRQLQRAPLRYGSGAIRSAIELLESHPERPWTAGALATEVGVSTRALHAGFHSKADVGPMTYLRQVRLARAHNDLLRADPATTTVSDVARHWGFAHLGRFSAAHAQRYGELPSLTLRRTGLADRQLPATNGRSRGAMSEK